MMDRRLFITLLMQGPITLKAFSQSPSEDFTRLLSELESDAEAVLKAKRFNELINLSFVPPPETLAQRPDLPRTFRRPSRRIISPQTRQLLISAEVSSRSLYERRFRTPIWPKGQSGVTIAIGYDIGYVTKSQFRTDWTGYIDNDRINALESACEIKANNAQSAADNLQHVEIKWEEAVRQFDYFVKLYMNLVEATFPNCNQISDNSFGALTSIVYNRGNGMNSRQNDPLDRRREMREIRTLMSQERFREVPDRIRSMKRIWQGDPDARGLLIRREAEAKLFEIGLNGS
ncbi:hypothetical protein [Bosea sp. Tri-44]|uniref:hypothetical protein n=1 Tax=Bosea sp. Tri-44 TaxID=1972137 RepID=UPI00100DD21C|nr:hypothetical protein [Bosea sp. Tri-44]